MFMIRLVKLLIFNLYSFSLVLVCLLLNINEQILVLIYNIGFNENSPVESPRNLVMARENSPVESPVKKQKQTRDPWPRPRLASK